MSAVFDADSEVRALTPWSIRIGGRVHVAKLVSRPALLEFWAAVERGKAGLLTKAEEDQAIAKLFRHAFPWRLSYRWRGDPVATIVALPDGLKRKAVDSFWASLANL